MGKGKSHWAKGMDRWLTSTTHRVSDERASWEVPKKTGNLHQSPDAPTRVPAQPNLLREVGGLILMPETPQIGLQPVSLRRLRCRI